MIGHRDRAWIALQKMRIRKIRTAFTVVSLSLGLTVFVALAALFEGIHAAFESTVSVELLTMPPEIVRVDVKDPTGVVGARSRRTRVEDADLERLARHPGVRAVGRRVTVHPVRLGLPLETPRDVSMLVGLEEPFLLRHVADGHRLWETPDRVPLVLGRAIARSRYDPGEKRFRPRENFRETDVVGHDVDLVVGSEEVLVRTFEPHHDAGKTTWVVRPAAQIAADRRRRDKSDGQTFELSLYRRVLRLKARVVGLSPFTEPLVPASVARDMAAWLDARRSLARKVAPASTGTEDREEDGAVWSDIPRVMVLAADRAHVRGIVSAVQAMGLVPVTRETWLEQVRQNFENGMNVVRWVFYGIGVTIFGIACLLVWTTIAKVVGDSRREIGVLRAVGATRHDVLSVFLFQAALMGVAGAVLGILQGWGLSKLVSLWVLRKASTSLEWRANNMGLDPSDVLPPSLAVFDLESVGLAVGAGLAASVLAGLVPARRAAHIDPVVALRQQD